MPHKKVDPVVRFWAKVRKSDGEGCWEWTAGKQASGHGFFFPKHGKIVRAYRYAWELTFGAIPAGLCVLHHCDNPACVRPDHLFLGTQADNMRDMDAKGRRAKHNPANQSGEKNHQAKLTADIVQRIKALSASGVRQAEIMRVTGVDRRRVWSIVHGETWKHISIDGRLIQDVLAEAEG